ncbi:FadR/GntR family transcriptional regulator [Clostridiaceae bacterium 35-E11]
MELINDAKGKPLAEVVADSIKSYIIDNDLKVGDKIPNEMELSEALGVGRGTIREAVKILVSRNILGIRRGVGTFVSEKLGIVDDPLGLVFMKDKQSLAMDLLDVRLMLEPKIASLAAKNATNKQIEELRIQCNKVEAAINNGENHTQEDILFHKMIAGCSGNAVVGKLIPVIHSSVSVFANVTHRKLRNETIETHRQIMEAIAEHDIEGAELAMIMHLGYNRRLIKKMQHNQENDD